MKKLLSLAIAAVMTVTVASANTFECRSNVATATLGVSGYGVPITLHYERGVYDINSDMSLGAGAKALLWFGDEGSTFGLGATGAYHYTGFEKFDLIGGLTLGVIPDVRLSVDLGSRYYFNDTWAATVMLSGGTSCGLDLGVSMKF